MLDRKKLRQLLRKNRSQLSIDAQIQHSEKICKQLLQQSFFLNSQTIAFYLAFDGEVNLKPLIEIAWKHNKIVALPMVPATNDRPLSFAQYTADTPIQLDRFGIESPDFSHSTTIAIEQLETVFTPLVGFDSKANRLGMGAGFYDRTFANFKPLMVGIAHQCQQVDDLQPQAWDIPLDYIVTEQQLVANI